MAHSSVNLYLLEDIMFNKNMKAFSILKYPAPVLKKRAEEVSDVSHFDVLIEKMISTMSENQGIGLAAPQVGISKRIIIVETSANPRETSKQKKGRPLAFFNPVVTKKSKKSTVEEEGCLSLPGVFIPVKRAESIELVCQTSEGEKMKIEAGGLTARIFQHEIDHLNGKLIINHLSPLKKLKLRIHARTHRTSFRTRSFANSAHH